VRLLMPSRSRSGLAGSACVLVWDHASASTTAVGGQNDEGPPSRKAALRRKAFRRKPDDMSKAQNRRRVGRKCTHIHLAC
jgi:hypothetical protein